MYMNMKNSYHTYDLNYV